MSQCRFCSSKNLESEKVKEGLEIVKCLSCGGGFLKDFPRKKQLEKFYTTQEYYRFWGKLSRKNIKHVEKIKKESSEKMINLIEKYQKKGKILDVGCATGAFLEVAKAKGWEVQGVECSPEFAKMAKKRLGNNIRCGMFEKTKFKNKYFDVVLFYDSLEHMVDPQMVVGKVKNILKPGGYLVIATPDRLSLSAKIMGKNWTHFKTEHLFYYSFKSMKKFLEKNDFKIVQLKRADKVLSITYINNQFQSFPTPVLTPLFKFIAAFSPTFLTDRSFNLPTGEMVVIAQKPTRN